MHADLCMIIKRLEYIKRVDGTFTETFKSREHEQDEAHEGKSEK